LKLGVLALAAALLTGCASSERFLWQEYTSEGIAAIGTGDFRRAEAFFKRALAKAEELGPQERGIALNGLGELYRRQGRHADAERMLRRAIEVKEEGLGPDHPDVATSLTNLGLVYAAAGHEAEAVPVLERAAAIQEKNAGDRAPGLPRTLTALAQVYRQLGREHDAFVVETRVKLLPEPRER